MRSDVKPLVSVLVAVMALVFPLLPLSAPPASAAVPFRSTWRTGSDAEIRLPLTNSGTYDFLVDWGDGGVDRVTAYDQPEATHVYPQPGTYAVTISGTIVGWSFNGAADAPKLLSVDDWGPLRFGAGGPVFKGASNLVSVPSPSPGPATGLSDLSSFFEGCSSLNGIGGAWDTSHVTTMSSMFRNASSFNQDIGGWDTSNVTDMNSMFQNATSLNQDLGGWRVGELVDASQMFTGASSFDVDNYGLLLSGWADQPVQPNVHLQADAPYPGFAARARQVLTIDHGWVITDAGPARGGFGTSPSKPTKVRANVTAKRAHVRWAPVTGAIHYTVKLTGKSPRHRKTVTTRDTGATRVTLRARLTKGTTARVCVTATNRAGSSAARCTGSQVRKPSATSGS